MIKSLLHKIRQWNCNRWHRSLQIHEWQLDYYAKLRAVPGNDTYLQFHDETYLLNEITAIKDTLAYYKRKGIVPVITPFE